MKKKILFVYYEMMTGGSTTSLLSLLYNFDYDKYDVDLLLYRNRGPFLKYIPDKVNLLPQAMFDQSSSGKIIKSVLNGELERTYISGLKYHHKFMRMPQESAYMQAKLCRRIDTIYDVAIGYLELWSGVFVNQFIKAKKKISWVHIDYEKAHYIPEIDQSRKTYNNSKYIVNVSDECLNNFNHSFPTLAKRTVMIENILTKSFVQKRLEDAPDRKLQLDDNALKLLTVCRIAIDQKGLDRGLSVVSDLVKAGRSIQWFIVGDGPDKDAFLKMIKEKHAENHVFMLGAMNCPFKLYGKFDAFFLPSRFEGKPMAVTEAQMLGLPPIVAAYASAYEQIEDTITGIVSNNDTESLISTIEEVYDNPGLLKEVRHNLQNTNFDNVEEINKIYKLIEG